MAPEILAETMNYDDFEAYKRADIYSFSLVMWETAQCAIKDGKLLFALQRLFLEFYQLTENIVTHSIQR